MKRQFFTTALTFGLSAATLILAGCSTTESRISEHPDIYQSLSPRDQALVSHGQIRPGMSQNAVWLAWGSAEQKVAGYMRGHSTETWIYFQTTTALLRRIRLWRLRPRFGYDLGSAMALAPWA
jgi:hypothetical protein